ncbi:IgaA/UmoB family intracellular growth attenuator [Salmonella enterica subsp. enterica serovar Dublin]|nr:IgaA/UmoB family intracellular growth attenuator [Salmonella enterica]WDX21693.1 IgaA/UmoB family intracellular growth attenuator [Salmonella enterica subsp. enterica serovar Dublin]
MRWLISVTGGLERAGENGANAGKLDGVNVLLRPASAESLENLVTTSTAPFISRETAQKPPVAE